MFNKIIAAAVLTLAASASVAMPTGIYAGVNAGTTRVSDLDGNESSVGAFAGYGINSAVAIEVGYRQHGDWDFYGAEVSIKQTDISVLGALPLATNLEVFGRLGYNHGKVEAKYAGFRGEEDMNNALYGVGLAYTFSPSLSGRVEVQKPASDTTNASVSLVWKF